MEVYIEYVIIDNLVITALICQISYRVLRFKASKIRTLLASIFGTICAVCYPFLSFSAPILLLIKFAVYVALSVTLFFKKPQFIKSSLVFLGTTAVFGGVMFMAGFMFYGNVQNALTLPFYDFSIGIILILPIFIYFLAKKLIKFVSKRQIIHNYTYKIEFSLFGKSFTSTAFLDTGNLLFDQKTGLPIVILGAGLSAKILSHDQMTLLVSNKISEIDRSAQLKSFNTLGKNGKILLLKPAEFRLYFNEDKNILKETMLGLSFNSLGKNFEAILPPSLLDT